MKNYDMKAKLAIVAVLLLAGSFVVSGLCVAAAQDQNIEQMVANAKTAEDHEAIASYYDKEAAQASAQANEHAQLASEYKKWPRMSTLAMHCERMAQAYKLAATEAKAAATEHREIASTLKPAAP